MRKVKYTGLRSQGTIRPRRMWWPGEILDVEDEIAEELVESPEFSLIVKRQTKRKKEEE